MYTHSNLGLHHVDLIFRKEQNVRIETAFKEVVRGKVWCVGIKNLQHSAQT